MTSADDDADDDRLRTIPELAQEATDAAAKAPQGAFALKQAIACIREQDTRTLMLRLSTVEHPLTLWALHVELDRRDVPPCLRPHAPEHSRQHVFIATLADLHWIASRSPEHETQHQRMRGVFRHPVRSDRWHRAALWGYRQCRGQRYLLASRLGLSDRQRCDTITMPTKQQSAARRALRERMPDMRAALHEHSARHPDKSGAFTAEQIAERRAELIRVHVLLGRSATRTARYVSMATGRTASRQAICRALETAATIADAERLVQGTRDEARACVRYGRAPRPKVGVSPNAPLTRTNACPKGVRS